MIPTALVEMGLEFPKEMTGRELETGCGFPSSRQTRKRWRGDHVEQEQ